MLSQCYEKINGKIDKTKTWFYAKRNCLVSREIEFKPYYSLASRYNNNTKETHYFILMFNELQEGEKCNKTKLDNYGRIKINISSILDKLNIKDKNNDCSINIRFVDKDDECSVYEIEM